jgi:hypothetical protein
MTNYLIQGGKRRLQGREGNEKFDHGLNKREDAISICGVAMKPITICLQRLGWRGVSAT